MAQPQVDFEVLGIKPVDGQRRGADQASEGQGQWAKDGAHYPIFPLRLGTVPRAMAARAKAIPATRMIAAPEGMGRSKMIGSRMPHNVLTVAIPTEIQKKPLSDWLSRRAAAAGITNSAPTRIAPMTLTAATVINVTRITNR